MDVEPLLERIAITAGRVQRFIDVYERDPTSENQRLVQGAMSDLRDYVRQARAAGSSQADIESATGSLPPSGRFRRAAEADDGAPRPAGR